MGKGAPEMDNRKRNLIDSLEVLRGGHRHEEDAEQGTADSAPDAQASPRDLHSILRTERATNALLEQENRRLERKALEAIAEVGRLRREMDTGRSDAIKPDRQLAEDILQERRALQMTLEAARQEGSLLTRALSESEAEVTRLSKTVELLVRKLGLAS